MRKKILYCLIGIITGIGIFINFENLNPLIFFFAIICLAILFYLTNKKLVFISIGLFLGFSLALINFSSFKLKDHGPDTFQVTILEKRTTDEGYRYIVNAKNKDKTIDEKSVIFSEEDYEIGDMVLVLAEPKAPNRNTNPNLFNYRNYLISKGIASELKVKTVFKEGKSKSSALKLRRDFYNYIYDTFERYLSPRSSDFVISVVLGENLIQNDEIRDLGLAHILAVSGIHMDLLIGFILYIFRKLNINYKLAYISSLALCVLYGYLISFPFSVIRVIIINVIGFLAFLMEEPEDKVKSLLVAAMLILIFNPFAILNAGFVLSFVATSGVYLVWPKIKVYLKDNQFSESIGFTTSIQTTLLPFSIYYYGKINLISIIANFFVVPLFTIAMYIIFGIIILYALLRKLLIPFFIVLDYLIESILNLTSILGRIKFLTLEFAHPSILIVIYLYILILISLYIKKSNKDLLKKFYCVSLLIVGLSTGYQVLTPEVSFSMIDIGQGDAFLLNDGGDYYLFDVGGPKYKSYDSGEKILVPYLKSLGIREIEGVFISHEDQDHSGNLEILYDNFTVKNLITNSYNIKGLAKFNPREMKLNDFVRLKNGYVKCVFEGAEGEENDESMGLLIEIDGIKILSLGDLRTAYEDSINIQADVLKVSHHGSRFSTSRKFVEEANPKVAFISAGRNNTYGHPTKEVIDNLDGVKIYNTQENGMVKIVFGKNHRIETFLKGGYFR